MESAFQESNNGNRLGGTTITRKSFGARLSIQAHKNACDSSLLRSIHTMKQSRQGGQHHIISESLIETYMANLGLGLCVAPLLPTPPIENPATKSKSFTNEGNRLEAPSPRWPDTLWQVLGHCPLSSLCETCSVTRFIVYKEVQCYGFLQIFIYLQNYL